MDMALSNTTEKATPVLGLLITSRTKSQVGDYLLLTLLQPPNHIFVNKV